MQTIKYSPSNYRFRANVLFCTWLCISNSTLGQESSRDVDFPVTDNIATALLIEQAVVSAVARAEKSVVAIARVRRDQAPGFRADQLQIPGGFPTSDSPTSPDFVPSDFASGVLISADGYIVTCAHALEDPRRNDYFVWLDKRAYEAQVVARSARVLASDPFTDLAILKIDAQNLTAATLGDGALLRKGQFVVALGNPYAIARDGQVSASWGIVSNLRRVAPVDDKAKENAILSRDSLHQFGTLIQTDARLNLGTSGGALINLRGELVGLTSSLAALSGYEQSAGFAIPVDDLFKRVVGDLREGRLPEFGFLGIRPEDLQQFERERGLTGVRVRDVVAGMPGEQAGLRAEDLIAQVNGRPIDDRNGLFRELSQLPAGAEVELLVQRVRRLSPAPELLRINATLSKKYVANLLPAYAIHGPKRWRGMLVEYTTAVPAELGRSTFSARRRLNPKLAILSVEPGSAAWKAGLRPGNGLVSVDGKEVERPEDFERLTEQRSDAVNLQVVRAADQLETILVLADEPIPVASDK